MRSSFLGLCVVPFFNLKVGVTFWSRWVFFKFRQFTTLYVVFFVALCRLFRLCNKIHEIYDVLENISPLKISSFSDLIFYNLYSSFHPSPSGNPNQNT